MAQSDTQSTGSVSTDVCSSESDLSYGDESTSTEYSSSSEEPIRVVAPKIVSSDEAFFEDDNFPLAPLPAIPSASESLEMVVRSPMSFMPSWTPMRMFFMIDNVFRGMRGQYISDSLHPNDHSGKVHDLTEPLAALFMCNVWFEYNDEFDCTVAIDYMLIWREGMVFCSIDKKADFVDPSKMGVAMYCQTPEDDVLIPPLFIDTATKANRKYVATYKRSKYINGGCYRIEIKHTVCIFALPFVCLPLNRRMCICLLFRSVAADHTLIVFITEEVQYHG